MRKEAELGLVQPGYFADLPVIDGDRLADFRILYPKTRDGAIREDRMDDQRRSLISCADIGGESEGDRRSGPEEDAA